MNGYRLEGVAAEFDVANRIIRYEPLRAGRQEGEIGVATRSPDGGATEMRWHHLNEFEIRPGETTRLEIDVP